jgi:uncharacterized protein YlxP (DUF503 family)
MVVAVLTLELRFPGARSLKDKRALLRPVIDRARHDYHVSIAEVDDLMLWGNSTVGASYVSNDPVHAEQVLRKVAEMAASRPEIVLDADNIEIFRFP